MRIHSSLRVAAATCIVVAAVSPPVHAQRITAKLEHQKRSVALEVGSTRFGKHTLDELKPGGEWRLGSNDASTLTVGAPLVAGTTVVPPGSYRVKLYRGHQDDFSLMIEGAGYELSSSTSLYLPGTYADEKKTADKLDVKFVKAKEKAAHGRASRLRVHFGPHSVEVPVTLAGTSSVKLKGFTVDAFAVPCDVVEARSARGEATPIASFAKKGRPAKDAPAAFSLLVSDDEAILLPAQVAPTDSYGFGHVVPPPEDWTFRAPLEWQDAQSETDTVELQTVELTKEKRLRVVVNCGGRTGEALLTPPTKPRRGAG